MAIRFTTGTLGAGKGLYWVKKIVEELRRTNRPILTNLAIRCIPWVRKNGKAEVGLQAYLQYKYGQDFNVLKRVHVLTDEQCKEFFMWRVNKRGELYRVKPLSGGVGLVGYDPESFGQSVPVTYWIDEAWQYFNSRDFMKTDRMLLCYNAQSRKMGDDLWIATQHHSQVEKNLRVLAAEYHECINHSKRRMGIFKQPGVITVVVSNDPPESRSRATAYTRTMKLDYKGLGACYDTASGTGVAGVSGDIGEKLSGVPWWVVVLLLFGLVAALAEVPSLAGRVVSHATKGFGESVHAKPAVPVVKASVPPASGPGVPPAGGLGDLFGVHVVKPAGPVVSIPGAAVPAREMTGFAKLGGEWRVFLDDGEVVSSREQGRLGFLCARYCVVDGVTNYMHKLNNMAWRRPGSSAAVQGSAVPPSYREVRSGATEGISLY